MANDHIADDRKKVRLIDANALRTQFDDIPPFIGMTGGCVQQFIDKAPTVDAVEVVRCKDCKHWLHVEEGFGDCTNPRFHLPGHADPTMNADDFCSCGERRENNA